MKYEYMKDIIKYLKKELPDNKSKEWLDYCKNLEELLNALAIYNTPNENNKYKSIDEDDYKKIDELFKNATKASNDYLKMPYDKQTVNEEIRYNVAKNLNDEFLNKAYIEYQNIKPNQNVSLRQSMEDFRNDVIELSSNDIKTVGGQLSTRTELTLNIDGKPVKGIFTKTTNFNALSEYEKAIDDMIEFYPEYADFYNKLKNEQGLKAFGYAINLDDFFDDMGNPSNRAFNNLFRHLDNETGKLFEDYMKYMDFRVSIMEISKNVLPIAEKSSINRGMLGLNFGDNIDKRNSAMSGIAHLLDKDDMLAKSRPVTIKQNINGKTEIVTGTFMEFAKGKDILNLDLKDEVYDYTEKNFDTPSARKSLANLQIIDYICGNIDRHQGNMFYDFDPVTHELRGVQGIDNDASFFSGKLEANDMQKSLMGINQMRVIDAEMALQVANLEEGPFKATLQGYGLNAKEIDAAWNRTKELQEAISKNEIYNPENKFEYEMPKEGSRIIIVPEDGWKKLSIMELDNGGMNIFGIVENGYEMLKAPKSITSGYPAKIALNETILRTKITQISDMLDDAKDAKNFIGSSKRYNNILEKLKAFGKTDNPDQQIEKLNELKGFIKTYYDEKKALGHLDKNNNPINLKGKDLTRVQVVNKIEKYVDGVFKIRAEIDDIKLQQQKEIKEVEEYNKTMELRKNPEAEIKEPVQNVEKNNIEQISISLDEEIEIKEEKTEEKNKNLEKSIKL